MIINNTNWTEFPDNLFINEHTNYIIKAGAEQYYTQIGEDYLYILSPDELNKASRYRQPADRKRFIAARHLLRTILSKILLTTPAAIQFQYTELKKPFLHGIEFNISHSGNYIVIALSSRPIGVDVELIDPGFDRSSLLAIIFNEDEVAYIKTSNNWAESFYTLWTRKEALLKATGEGLTDDLETVSCINSVAQRGQNTYYLSSLINDGHLISIATAHANAETKYLTI